MRDENRRKTNSCVGLTLIIAHANLVCSIDKLSQTLNELDRVTLSFNKRCQMWNHKLSINLPVQHRIHVTTTKLVLTLWMKQSLKNGGGKQCTHWQWAIVTDVLAEYFTSKSTLNIKLLIKLEPTVEPMQSEKLREQQLNVQCHQKDNRTAFVFRKNKKREVSQL